MARKIVYFSDLTRRDGSSLKLTGGLEKSSVFSHDRTEIQNVFDLDDLDVNLAGVAPFEVEKESSPTFSAALELAAKHAVKDKGGMAPIRDKNDEVVCYVMI